MMRLAYYGAELGMTDIEIYSIVYFLDEKWEKFKNRRDRQRRLLDMVAKAKQKYPEAVEPTTYEGLLEKGGDEEVVRDPRQIFRFGDFLKTEYKVEWMIDQLAARKSIGLIASAPGKGKTQFMLNLGMHAVIGKPFVGYAPNKPHRVLFLSFEMGAELLSVFTDQMAKAYTEEEVHQLQENFFLMPAGNPMPLRKEGKVKGPGQQFLEQTIEELKPDAVYIDSLARILPGKFDDEDIIQLFGYLSVLRRKYGTYFFIVHHNRKAQGDNKRPKNLEDIYGSQFIGAEIDWGISLFPEQEPGVLEVNEVKNRLAMQRPSFHIKRVENLQFEVIEYSGLQKGAPNASLDLGKGFLNFT
jgi:hypothetical protein